MSMHLRFLTEEDCSTLLEWRNDPVTRAMSRLQHVVSAEQHQRWFTRAVDDPVRIMLMGMVADRKVGLVRFDPIGEDWEVSINVNPAERGKGLGKTLLKLGMEHFWAIKPQAKLVAEVRPENAPSQRIFESCGFVMIRKDHGHFMFEAARV